MNKALLACGLMASAALSHAQTKTPPDLTNFISELKSALIKQDGNFVFESLDDRIAVTLDPKPLMISKPIFARAWNLPSRSFIFQEMLFALAPKGAVTTKTPAGYEFSASRPFNMSEKHVLGRRMLMKGAPHKFTHTVFDVSKVKGQWKITTFLVYGGPN